ncbi:MAG: E3 binding domain-containing protein, partial [Pseudomonadota bacterium]|nr:E3 binding domain-containing protein [Pseudomonadota bacterium]
MGTYVFKLPDVGEGVAQAEIVAWHVAVGDEIKEDQPLVDVMTEKATVEIGSPVSGKILRRKGETGDMAAVGAELVAIATRGQEETQAPTTAGPVTLPTSPVARSKLPLEPLPQSDPPADRVQRRFTTSPQAAPAVRARAAALGIDLAAVEGRGPEGRIRHEDLDAALL